MKTDGPTATTGVSAPREGPVFLRPSPRTVASFVGATLLAALIVVPSFWALQRSEETAAERKHTYEVLEACQRPAVRAEGRGDESARPFADRRSSPFSSRIWRLAGAFPATSPSCGR